MNSFVFYVTGNIKLRGIDTTFFQIIWDFDSINEYIAWRSEDGNPRADFVKERYKFKLSEIAWVHRRDTLLS